jgi:hypothetical protein
LDDNASNRIYQWFFQTTTGEVFITRTNNISWSSVGCPSNTSINNEDIALGFTGTAIDSINNTFNETSHRSFSVAGRTINDSACNTTATYVNSTQQSQAVATFQEVLLHDGTNMIFATAINDSSYGYDSDTTNNTYDFQAIVPDNTSTQITSYYFWVEIG